jgi:hypothetical protein
VLEPRTSSKHSSQVIVGSGLVSLTTMMLFSLSLLLTQTNLKPLSFCLYPSSFLSPYKPLAVVVAWPSFSAYASAITSLPFGNPKLTSTPLLLELILL